MSGREPELDREEKNLADRLAHHHAPYWLVMWLTYHREWEAFYLGPATVAPLRHTDLRELSARMWDETRSVTAARTPRRNP